MASGVTAIKGTYRVIAILLALLFGALADVVILLPGGPTWATNLSARTLCSAAVTVIAVGCVARAWRMGLYASDDGLVVRNFLPSHQFGWADIRCLDNGELAGGEGKAMWVLVVVTNDGRAIKAFGTGRDRLPRGMARDAIQDMARRFGVSCPGRPSAPRSRACGNRTTQSSVRLRQAGFRRGLVRIVGYLSQMVAARCAVRARVSTDGQDNAPG
jgi:hypothetical protein